MSTVANETVRKPVRTTKKSSAPRVPFLTTVKSYFIKHRMAKAWGYRNLLHGEVFIEALEVDHIIFQQNCFIESSKSIDDKLFRLQFEVQTVFPDSEQYQDFCATHYNANHNISICLYPTKHKNIILTAQKIADKTTKDIPSGLAIFLNTINVLIYR